MANELVNPYEQIWKTRDLSSLEKPIELDNKLGQFRRGLGAFANEMQAMGHGLVALGSQGVENLVGENAVTKSITDWGLEGYNRNIEESQTGLNKPNIARIEDVNSASDAFDWASHQLGKGLPMLASLAATGGIGGAVARLGAKEGVKQLAKSAVGDLVKKNVVAKGINAVEGQVVTNAMKEAAAASLRDSFVKGSISGGFAGSFGVEGGLAFGEQVAAGADKADAVKSAIAVGGINGALEFLPIYRVAKQVGLGEYAKKGIGQIIADTPELSKRAVALAKEVGGRAAKGFAEGSVTEGVTEGLQELVSIAGVRWAKNEPLFDKLTADDWSQIGNAALTGALVGGVASGAGATISSPKAEPESKPSALPQDLIQNRKQLLEALRDHTNKNIEEAQANNNNELVSKLEQSKKKYDDAIQALDATLLVENQPTPAEITNEPPTVVPPVGQMGLPLIEPAPAQQPPIDIQNNQSEAPSSNQNQLGFSFDNLANSPSPPVQQVGSKSGRDSIPSTESLFSDGLPGQLGLPYIESSPTVEPQVQLAIAPTQLEPPAKQQNQLNLELEESAKTPTQEPQSQPIIDINSMYKAAIQDGSNDAIKPFIPPGWSLVESISKPNAKVLAQQNGPGLVSIVDDKIYLASDGLNYGSPITAYSDFLKAIGQPPDLITTNNETPAVNAVPATSTNAQTQSQLLNTQQTADPDSLFAAAIQDGSYDALSKLAPPNWFYDELGSDDTIKFFYEADGKGAFALESDGTITYSDFGALSPIISVKSYSELLNIIGQNNQQAQTTPNQAPAADQLSIDAQISNALNSGLLDNFSESTSLYDNDNYKEYWSKDNKSFLSVDNAGKVMYFDVDVATGAQTPKAIYNSLNEFLSSTNNGQVAASKVQPAQATNKQPDTNNQAKLSESFKKVVQDIIQSGKSTKDLTSIISLFRLDNPNSLWELSYNNNIVKIISKVPPGYPKWNLYWDHVDNSINFDQQINGIAISNNKLFYVADIQNNAATGQSSVQGAALINPSLAPNALNLIDPWLVSELLHDSDNATFAALWIPDAINVVTEYKNNTITFSKLIDKLSDSLVISPHSSVLENSVKSGQSVPPEAGGIASNNLIKNRGVSPNIIAKYVEMTPPGWEFESILIIGDSIVAFYTNNSIDGLISINQDGTNSVSINSQNMTESFSTYANLMGFLSATPGLITAPTTSTMSSSAASWAPLDTPAGYELNFNRVVVPEGITITTQGAMLNDELREIAHIHNYLKYAQIPVSEKIKLFKELPTSSAALAAFKAKYPYLMRKVSIDEATTIDHGKELLNDILVRRDKYTFEEILEQSIKFETKFGNDELIAALASAPKEIYNPPQLLGWLSNMRSEEELLNENPFQGVWAEHEVNATSSQTGSRYGVIIVNPKTGKVLLRKVSNQFEGITWDFARGGADRFADPGPNRIDTNGLGSANAPAHKRYMEHPLLAAKREAKEEFGFEVTVVGQLAKGFYTGQADLNSSMASLYYVAVPVSEQTNEHLTAIHGIQETDETRWVDLHEARSLIATKSTLPINYSMLRDGKEGPRLAKNSRVLEAVFDPGMQYSDLDYQSNYDAMSAYYRNRMYLDFPDILNTGKAFDALTELQKLQVAAALYVSTRFPKADSTTRTKLQKEVFFARRAALRAWMKDRVGIDNVGKIVKGNENIGIIQSKLAETGGKIVMSLWHGNGNTQEALLGDSISPVYLGMGWGGHDTKEGLYLADTKEQAKKWGRKKQVNMIVAFNNLKVIPGTTNYSDSGFSAIIEKAKIDGYDGVLFDNVDDTYKGRQVVVWNAENIIAGGGTGVGFTGKNLYQSKGELKQPMDVGAAKIILEDTFGPAFNSMLDSGLIEFVESGGPDGVAGQWFGDEQKIRIYMDYISSPRELIGAVLHEGSHGGLREMLGKSAISYHKEILESNSPVTKSAIYKTALEGAQRYGIENILVPENSAEIDRVRLELSKIDPNFLIEEDLANFVQQADQGLPLWKKLYNAIKAWWAQSAVGKLFKERGIGFELTPEMAAGLVTAALRSQSLRRGNDYSTYVAHVSGNEWKSEKNYPNGRPLLSYILKSGGTGWLNYGWGFYALESVAAYSHYKTTSVNKSYGLHLPDDIPPRMLEWDRPLRQQGHVVKSAITSSRDNYLLLRLALASRNKTATYFDDYTESNPGVGGALYNELRDYYVKIKYNNANPESTVFDNETNSEQKILNLASRDASRKLTEHGIAGNRLLDANSRFLSISKQANGTYKIKQGKGANVKTITVPESELVKYVEPELINDVKSQTIGVYEQYTGFGYYNWVFWRQTDLDRFTVVYKNGNQVASKPNKNVAYDVNGIGVPYAESPGFTDYVINPKTGENVFLSKANKPIGVSLEELRNNIDNVMGKGWLEQAEAAGLVEVVAGPGPNGEAGSWAGDKIRLYAGSMPAGGSPVGVLLHEGKHATFKEVLGKALDSYINDLRTLANNGNQSARDAIIRATVAAADILGIKHDLREGGQQTDLDSLRAAIEEKSPGLLAEEELAYFVEYGTKNQEGVGFLRRLLNQIKAWFAQTKIGQRLKEIGIGFEMTDGMAVEWAKMGLHQSLSKMRETSKIEAGVLFKAAYMPLTARLGTALELLNRSNMPYGKDTYAAYYSMGIEEIKAQLWTDPTDSRLEMVNHPGLIQRIRADIIDFFAEIEKKSKGVYDTFTLMRSKKAARMEQARQQFLIPLRNLIASSPWTAEEVGDMLAARHIKIDNVNVDLAERASDGYLKQLIKMLPTNTKKAAIQERQNIKAGKMPDGAQYVDANGQPITMSARTKRKLMFDLMNKYAPLEIPVNNKQELREEWEKFKDGAGGFSNGGVASNVLRKVDDILALSNKDQAKFDKIARLFDSMNRHVLDILEEGGLITAQEHARLLTDKSAYAPLRRKSYNVDNEIDLLFQRAGSGGSKQIATRTGTAELSEPALVLQNALAKVDAAAAAAERNLANMELYKEVVADRDGWKPWFSIVEKDKYSTHDEDGFLQDKNSTALNKADIVLIVNGKKLVIRPNMHNERAMGFVRAVNNLDAQTLGGPMKILGWLNSIVRWVNVTASPVFLMMNAIRDPFTALYNIQANEAAPYTKEIFENYGRSFKALKKVFMDGNRDPLDSEVRMVEEWEEAGGRTSFVDSLRAMDDTWRSFDAQVARRQGGLKYAMVMKDKWIDGIENFNILFENVMRLSTYNVLVKNGVNSKRAARISQDLTTNFTRRGYKTQALGTWWLFFNATVQGNYQVIRNMLASHRLQAMVGGTVVFAVMLDLFGRAVADDWDKIPEWDKERFIVLPIKIGGDFVKIPAPWVFNIFWRMGGMFGETLSGVRKPQDMVLDLAAISSTAFSPLGKPGSIAQAISPTGLDPFVQILENKDFAGNPLGPEGFPGANSKANSELIWSNTPKGYQDMARFVNEFTGGSATEPGVVDLRPADYQLLAKFLTGSLGRFMSDITFGLKDAIKQDITGPKDIPIIKELFSDPYDPVRSQRYHENVAGIYGAKRLEQLYLRGADRDLIKLHEVRTTRGKELQMYEQAKDVERQLKSLRVRLRAAQNRNDRKTENELRDKIGKLHEQFNSAYKQKVG